MASGYSTASGYSMESGYSTASGYSMESGYSTASGYSMESGYSGYSFITNPDRTSHQRMRVAKMSLNSEIVKINHKYRM